MSILRRTINGTVKKNDRKQMNSFRKVGRQENCVRERG